MAQNDVDASSSEVITLRIHGTCIWQSDVLMCEETLEDEDESLSIPNDRCHSAPCSVDDNFVSGCYSGNANTATGSSSVNDSSFAQSVSLNTSNTTEEFSDSAVSSGDSYHPDADARTSTDEYWNEEDRPQSHKRKLPQRNNKKKAQKGFAQTHSWKQNKHFKSRMKGEAYMGRRKGSDGKTTWAEREAQMQGPPCTAKFCLKSKSGTCQAFTQEERTEIYTSFWTKLDWNQKKTYVNSLVSKERPQTPTTGKSRRTATHVYHLRNTEGERKQVCKLMFLNTLGIKEWSVHNWTKAGGHTGTHKSSHHKNRKTIPSHKKQLVRNFLTSLPTLPSHYCRQHSQKQYLETTIESWTKLYKVFQTFCETRSVPRVSSWILRKEAKSLNIALSKPKKDECNLCLSYQYGHCFQEEYDAHTRRKEEAKAEKIKDKRTAEDDDSVVVVTMDLQAVLLAPKPFANAQYFKTKLACHNFTMYELASRRCVCYFWDETRGDVSAENFASCISNYVTDVITNRNGVRTIILISDGCCYQNRNVTLSNCLLQLAMETGVTIQQKYLEKGHTWMEVDSCHSLVERRLRRRQIYWPAYYLEVIASARTTEPYITKSLEFSFFRDFSKLSFYRSIRPGTSVGDPHVTDIRALLYGTDGVISYKLHHTDPWKPLPRRHNKAGAAEVAQRYSGPRRITSTKFQHLQDLKPVIPREYHAFYDGLLHE